MRRLVLFMLNLLGFSVAPRRVGKCIERTTSNWLNAMSLEIENDLQINDLELVRLFIRERLWPF
jgi:hypothetical protein